MGDYVGDFRRDRMFYFVGILAFEKYLDRMNTKAKIVRAGWGGLCGYYLWGLVARGGFYLAVFTAPVLCAHY